MRFLPRGTAIIRRLLGRLRDEKAYNDYLVDANDNLVRQNDQLSIAKLRSEGEATTLRWKLEDMKRAIENIGTEDE